MKHFKILSLASAAFLMLAGCSQQQVSDGGSSQVAGSSQQVASSQQQVSESDAEKACEACNAPKVEAVVTPPPTPKSTVVTSVPPKKTYTKRRHVPTVPSKKNASSAMVMNIQKALKAKGYNPGTIDGVMGARTVGALHAFQKANKIPVGDLNHATMAKLGLMK